MATAKKAPVKKTVAKKTPAKKASVATKAPIAKKAPVTVKKTTVTKKSVATAPKMKSFRVATNEPAFTSFKITRQTVYWTLLIAFIIFMQLWILSLQVETSSYIESQRASLNADS